ncbi:capsid protein [Chiunvirus muliumi]|uniref:Capsid protein n=1 Tax=Blackfly DNA Virus 12 TaxID=2586175 RepID=A0A4Y5QKV1_9VIRU|nr:capsid protein [Blackfly DNA Virus 12]
MIGALSAATLGYIHGNTRGAINSAALYRKLSQMAPIKRKASNSNDRRKRAKQSKTKFTVNPVPVIRRNSNARLEVNPQAPKVRGKRRTYTSKKKTVKVTKQFKKKVEKAMAPSDIKGTYIEIDYDLMRFVSNDNQQAVFLVDTMFNPSLVLDAASVLWNKKALTNNKITTNASNFQRNTARIHVDYASYTMDIKNNTRRTYTLKLFCCKHKIKDSPVDPVTAWQDSLAVEAAAGGANVVGNTKEILYNDPRYLQNWNNQFSAEVTTITLEPGQIYKYVVQGPKNKLYDFAKYVKDSTPQLFTDFISDARFVFGIYYPDVVSTTLASSGRFTDPEVGTIAEGLVYEAKWLYKLSMPQQAGSINPATFVAGAAQPDNLRRSAFAIYQRGSAQAGLVNRVDDDNPIVVENNL